MAKLALAECLGEARYQRRQGEVLCLPPKGRWIVSAVRKVSLLDRIRFALRWSWRAGGARAHGDGPLAVGRPVTSPAARIPLMDRLPPWLWLTLTVACLTPVWLWSTARFTDGSDDPLGIVALITLVVLLARDRKHFSERPGAGWLLLTFALAALAVLGGGLLPALARGVLAVLAVCTALWAVRAPGQPMLALTGLGLLALPLLSSLQYFVGYPLRVVTAEASRWLLSPFIDVAREGAALSVAGHLVIVDAPCSGIQMAWVAYFTACAVAALWRVPDLHLLRRIPFVGATVLAGNIVRNTLLVLKEGQLVHWPDWTHEAIGLVVTGLVCLLVQWQVSAGSRPAVIERDNRFIDMLGYHRSALGTWARLVSFTGLSVLLLWPWVQPEPVAARSVPTAVEWPAQLDGQPLRPLALSDVERRFADRFPGAIARFTDGQSTVVLRQVTTPTRMLHPAEDCYRGLGYRVMSYALEQQASARSGATQLTRCMIVEKKGQQLRVCENIVDAQGQTFTDTSAWYWAAVMGRTQGPWLAVTKAAVR